MPPCRAILVSEYGQADRLVLAEKETPLPGPGQVQIRVEAAGVNPSDTYKVLGPAGPYGPSGTNTPWLIPALPYTPGGDGAGVVSALGDGVTEFAVGDRVYLMTPLVPKSFTSGTFAEFTTCDVSQVFPLPDRISFTQGAAIGVPAATAYRALWQRGQLQPTESLFVHGASGGVGLAAVQMAAAAGCFVVGSAGSAAGMEAVQMAGANCVVNHKAEDYLFAAKAALPEGSAGFDVVLENFAHINLLPDLGVMGKNGRLLIVGSRPQSVGLNPRLTMPNELDIRGVFLPMCSAEEVKEIHAELFKLMEADTLVPVVGLQFGLQDASKSHVEVMRPTAGGAVGKIVVCPRMPVSIF